MHHSTVLSKTTHSNSHDISFMYCCDLRPAIGNSVFKCKLSYSARGLLCYKFDTLYYTRYDLQI